MARARHIALVGLMGAGKSTLGKRLAKKLGRPFCDLDEVIVARAGKPIPAIFAEDGEAAFREMEAQALAEALANPKPLVIATGGGVVERADNRARLRKQAFVVWLDAPPEVLAARIAGDRNRPLLAGEDPFARMRMLDRRRRAWYAEVADLRVSTEDFPPDALVARLMQAWAMQDAEEEG